MNKNDSKTKENQNTTCEEEKPQDHYSINMLEKFALIFTILKNGTVPFILGFEILYQKFYCKDIQNDLKYFNFNFDNFQKSQESLNFTFKISLIMFFISISSFIFMKKHYSKIQANNISMFWINILFLFIFECFLNSFLDLLKVKTGIELADNLFSFQMFSLII